MIIGRSPYLPDYVKHECEKAVIDSELFNPYGLEQLYAQYLCFLSWKSINKENAEVSAT